MLQTIKCQNKKKNFNLFSEVAGEIRWKVIHEKSQRRE